MIFYFSATGNCKHVAQRLAAADEAVIPIAECMKSSKTSFALPAGESLGFVSLTYFWGGVPSIVCDFLDDFTLKARNPPYIYLVATYDTTTRQMAGMADKILQRKGLALDARFSVKMPDTWTVIFDLSDKEKVNAKNAAAEKEIAEIAEKIKSSATGNYIKSEVPYFVASCVHPHYEAARQTSHLTVGPGCIGCALCAKKCPVQAIEMREGHPVWSKDQCTMCLGCLHRRPKFAIQYGNKTQRHGQYKKPYAQI